jgi:putative membrane protein
MDHGTMQQMMGGDGWNMMGGGFMWFWVVMVVVMVVVLALLVAGAIWLARTLTRPPNPPSGPGPARAELDLRYARGELDREEYLQRRADLDGGQP